MFVVSVTLLIQPESVDKFRRAILANAHASLAEEDGCLRFDVAEDKSAPRFVLWEVYADKQAFDAHHETQHFAACESITSRWVEAKSVETFAMVSELG